MRSLFSVLQRSSPTWSLPGRTVRKPIAATNVEFIYARCRIQQQRPFSYSRQLKDFNVDHPATLVRVGQKHGPGLIILASIPIIAFVLGCWQVQRLGWKTNLIAKFEDRLVKAPLPLPPRIDPDAITEFDYRRVIATGHFDHEHEMLIGPRMLEGEDGFMVVTPLKRDDGESTVLVNRGWISKKLANQKDRPLGLPLEEVTVEGLLREPWKKNMFTPDNKPEEGKFYFPDIKQMAEYSGSQPVWIEETMVPDLLVTYDRTAKGIPIGRAAEVNLKNNHAQYIFTWFSLSLATSIMMWMVVRKNPNEALRRVRQNRNW
ncbi:Surfeit locus 1 [Penicillium taxi]|uniref:Surfeit locus 1 n=1 Tax=Penicillium taxi TaxID=168475 RepID=UPI0025459F38|nr:Surfeit locus 1 [Penicillium taxi]KAJ5884990.1 Surfeit locus 1 [Penicillium taxi]